MSKPPLELNNNTKRRKTPTVFQMEALECGAASIAIVLGYYKRFIPLEQLREDCGVSRDGAVLDFVLEGAKKHGLEPIAQRATIDQLSEDKTPFMAYWNYNHYLIVEGFDEKQVYLNDPAQGHRTCTYEDFAKGFSGINVTFEKGPNFKPFGRPKSTILNLYYRLKDHKRPFFYLVLISLCMTFFQMLMPIFSKIFIDNYLVGKMESIAQPLIVGLLASAVIMALLTLIKTYFTIRFQHKLSALFSSTFFWHLLNLPSNFFAQRQSGDILQRMMSNEGIANSIINSFLQLFLNFVQAILYFILMMTFDWFIGLCVLLLGGVNIYLSAIVMNIQKDASQKSMNDSSNFSSKSFNAINLIETLKASGQEKGALGGILGSHTNMLNTQQRLQEKTMLLASIPSYMSQFTSLFIIIAGSVQILNGTLTAGGLVALQVVAGQFMGPFQSFIQGIGGLLRMTGQINKVDDVLNYRREEGVSLLAIEKSDIADEEKVKLSGNIEIKNVSFGYSQYREPALKNFSLTIEPGERVAIVGTSGSGKSTLAKLLCRLYDPWSGQILIDGKPIEDINRMILLNSIAMVNQDVLIFNGSVTDNVTLWDHTKKFEDVVQACRDACIHYDISEKPGGYEYELKEKGSNLSGGQRQRLEIARALINDPRVLILDEATSALDPITEHAFDDNVKRRGCTIIIIAHRLSTIRNADKIVVLENGEIQQIGTHEELIKVEGAYKRLVAVGA